jgi:hypothetical protein
MVSEVNRGEIENGKAKIESVLGTLKFSADASMIKERE